MNAGESAPRYYTISAIPGFNSDACLDVRSDTYLIVSVASVDKECALTSKLVSFIYVQFDGNTINLGK